MIDDKKFPINKFHELAKFFGEEEAERLIIESNYNFHDICLMLNIMYLNAFVRRYKYTLAFLLIGLLIFLLYIIYLR